VLTCLNRLRFFIENIIFIINKTSYPNEEINRTKPSPVSIPCRNKSLIYFNIIIITFLCQKCKTSSNFFSAKNRFLLQKNRGKIAHNSTIKKYEKFAAVLLQNVGARYSTLDLCVCVYTIKIFLAAKRPNLKLKTGQEQVLHNLPLAFTLVSNSTYIETTIKF
jgi:hypothetical protein